MTDPVTDAFAALEAERDAREAKEFAEMFMHPAICRYCGAFVAIPEAHKAFHDHLNKFAENIDTGFDSIVKAAGLRPGGNRPDRKANR